MNKSELDRLVAMEFGKTVEEVSIMTAYFLHLATKTLAAGEELHLRCFGSLRVGRHTYIPPPPNYGKYPKGKLDHLGRISITKVWFTQSETLKNEFKKKLKE